MDENNVGDFDKHDKFLINDNCNLNFDIEYKRYLQIMRPYLGQLVDQDIIDVCNAWIQRLSNCSENEKTLRNKYIFNLCYQLARGILDEPFINCPPIDELQPLTEGFESNSSTEVEYVVIDAEEPKTKVIFNNKRTIASGTECISRGNEYDDDKIGGSSNSDSKTKIMTPSHETSSQSHLKQTILCYTCPEILRTHNIPGEEYEYRANNLIMKLREIKKQNMLLQNELIALKEESQVRADEEESNESVLLKVDNTTSNMYNESCVTLKSLKTKLKEAQETRNSLITTISNQQDQIDNFQEMKKHEIEDIEANQRLEIIKIKTSVREETKRMYEERLEELKQQYENTIKDLQRNAETDLHNQAKIKDEIIGEKSKAIQEKDIEITGLKAQIEEQKHHLHSILNRFLEKPIDDFSSDSVKIKAHELEKRLSKMEKSKIKCAKAYETKLAYLQREKHLAECSLQLQLVRQRAQVVNEITNENQAELSTALDKLETKYKDIVATVQATAIQRRMHDQSALDAIIKAACGIQNHNTQCQNDKKYFSNNQNQFLGKNGSIRNQKEVNQSYESELSGLLMSNVNPVGNIGKFYEEESVAPGYCLESERLNELIEKVYIPQRDTGEGLIKK